MKIFLTGDNHIGLEYLNHPKKEYIIAERLNAISRMVDKANDEKCELLVVAGDLFDNNESIPKNISESVSNMLSEFKGQVLILPGNHDFYTPEVKLWKDFPIGDRMLLLKEYKTYPIHVGDETVVIYPAFCDSKLSSENRIGWIKELCEQGEYHIGISHGAIKGKTPDVDGTYFLMTKEELENIPVDIWLIGHTHTPFPRGLTENYEKQCERIFNAGTHVQRDVNNNTDGECFIIEIDNSKKIRAKKFCPSELRFYRIKEPIEVKPNNFENILKRELGRFGDKSEVDITINGVVTDEEFEKCSDILDGLGNRFLDFQYHKESLVPFIGEEQIKRIFPETDLSAKLLLGLLDDPIAVKTAYDMLVELKGEK